MLIAESFESGMMKYLNPPKPQDLAYQMLHSSYPPQSSAESFPDEILQQFLFFVQKTFVNAIFDFDVPEKLFENTQTYFQQKQYYLRSSNWLYLKHTGDLKMKKPGDKSVDLKLDADLCHLFPKEDLSVRRS